MSKVTSISFNKATKINLKLLAKLQALAEAQVVIRKNALTKGERIATVNRLEELWAAGAEEHLPDVEDFLRLLREGQRGWVDSSDAELAGELIGFFDGSVNSEEQQ
jgi:hypothetical protein